MQSQKEVERAEQQRIKNLVLNYDLQDSGEADGTDKDFLIQSNTNLAMSKHKLNSRHYRHHNRYRSDRSSLECKENLEANTYNSSEGSFDKHHHHHHHQHNAPLLQSTHHQGARLNDKGTVTKNGQRARKLQLSDVDWYVKPLSPSNIQKPTLSGNLNLLQACLDCWQQ